MPAPAPAYVVPRPGARRGSARAGTARTVALLLAPVAVAGAQPAAAPDSADHPGAGVTVATTGALILAGAAGTQLIRSPTAWPRTAGGFGRRVADQSGFYVLQTGTARLIDARTGWRLDERPCPTGDGTGRLVGCALARTFTALDRDGVRHANASLLTSVVLATGASLAWRPERRDPAKAWTFLGTRLGVVLAGYAGERLLLDWWRGRRASAGSAAGGGDDDRGDPNGVSPAFAR